MEMLLTFLFIYVIMGLFLFYMYQTDPTTDWKTSDNDEKMLTCCILVFCWGFVLIIGAIMGWGKE